MNSPEFDSQRATDMRRQAAQDFQRHMRRRAIIVWLVIMALATLCAIAGQRWTLRSDPQERLLYAVIYFLSVQSMVLVSLWYWIGPRITLLLKEMKLLRIDLARDSAEGPGGASESLLDVLTKRHFSRWTVLAASIATIMGTSLLVTVLLPPKRVTPCEIQEYYTLGDGESAGSMGEGRAPWRGSFPKSEMSTYCDADVLEVEKGPQGLVFPGKWWDAQGRELPVEVRLTDDGKSYEFKAKLLDPIMPGDNFVLRSQMRLAHFIKKEGDAWRVHVRSAFGMIDTRYKYVFKMPKNSQLVEGHPDCDLGDGEARYAIFQGTLKNGQPLELSFTYKIN